MIAVHPFTSNYVIEEFRPTVVPDLWERNVNQDKVRGAMANTCKRSCANPSNSPSCRSGLSLTELFENGELLGSSFSQLESHVALRPPVDPG